MTVTTAANQVQEITFTQLHTLLCIFHQSGGMISTIAVKNEMQFQVVLHLLCIQNEAC